MRIAIVNDELQAVDAMQRMLQRGASRHELAWAARDGTEAVEQCKRDKPDLILMDLFMPRMDGVEATRRIMAKTPCAIVVITADINRHSAKVFEALGAGALDVVNTSVLNHPENLEDAAPLLAKIETLSKLIGDADSPKKFPPAENGVRPLEVRDGQLVVMGASAGGPAALATVLAALPTDFPAAVVIVQHVDAQFAEGLANWLQCQTPLRVRLAQDGDHPQMGEVLLTGREDHIVFASPHRLTYTRQPAETPFRPSVDVFYKSVARFWPGKVVGVLLTGMGRDGAKGLKALRDRGHHTIAQNEATSAVYGMPKAAAELNAATEILALDKIGPRLTNIFAQKVKA